MLRATHLPSRWRFVASAFTLALASILTVASAAGSAESGNTASPVAASGTALPGLELGGVGTADGSVDAEVPETAAADGSGQPEEEIGEAQPPPSRLFDGSPPHSVVVIDVTGEITPATAAFVERSLLENADAGLVVVSIDTFGGRVDAAVRIRDALLDGSVPTVAYVAHRAISAGALIALAAEHVVFGPAATMGAATPVQLSGGEVAPVEEKMVSYMRAELRATAEARGRRADLAEAMVDRTVVVEGVVDGETLLTVTTREAIQLGLADGVSSSVQALLEQIGAESARVARPVPTWAERVAGFLTSPTVAGILMMLGVLGLTVEIYQPGFGFPGIIGTLCLAAFFFGHMVASLAGWVDVLLLMIGVGLLVIEVFVIPGFGVAGVAGILAILAALVLAMIDGPVGIAWESGSFDLVARRAFFTVAGAVGVAFAIGRFLPARALPDWLVLRARIGDTSGAAAAPEASPRPAVAVGDLGVALTDLRPAGLVRFGTTTVDVVSRSIWVDAATAVVVTEVGGVRVVVEPADGESSLTLGN